MDVKIEITLKNVRELTCSIDKECKDRCRYYQSRTSRCALFWKNLELVNQRPYRLKVCRDAEDAVACRKIEEGADD